MRTIIIDDEPDAVEALHLSLMETCPEVAVAGKFNDPVRGLEAIRLLQPDLVFLDVEMPGLTGFQLLEQLETISFAVVFTTAHDRFAVKAFRFSAIDYLLKPVDPEQLRAAVDKAAEKRRTDKMQIELLQHHFTGKGEKQHLHKIALPSAQGYTFVEIADILYCESDNSYTKFFVKNGNTYLVTKNLGDVEEMLSDDDFFRIHKQFLINLRQISKYVRGDGGFVVMPNGVSIPVSRVKKDAFTALFRKF